MGQTALNSGFEIRVHKTPKKINTKTAGSHKDSRFER